MYQDYRMLSSDQLELLEKQTLRTIVQALQEYSREAREIFETTAAQSETEVIVLAEDLVQYALEVAEVYPIDKRFAGFIDYKRVRWLPTPFGLFPQALLVDAKASTENTRGTLQHSQLPMDAEYVAKVGGIPTTVTLSAGIPPHLEIDAYGGRQLVAITTSVFIHFYYKGTGHARGRFRELRSIYVLGLPHRELKDKYNPDASTTFFGKGKEAPSLGEPARIRVYFTRLKRACPWRLQQLQYVEGQPHALPVWRDADEVTGEEVTESFTFIGRGVEVTHPPPE